MPIYLALWRTPKFEEEAWEDPASRHLVRWLRRAQMRNDLWCVKTHRTSSEHPWSIFVWGRPVNDRGAMYPAPSTAPTGICDEYYRCSSRGVDGGFVRVVGSGRGRAMVRTGLGLMFVPSGK